MSNSTDPIPPEYFSYRPDSYWQDGNPLAAILRNVKGTNRRRIIVDYWNAGKIDELAPELLEDETDPELKSFLEGIDPSFMGGEYLPDLGPTEVEIVRVELKSTTSDVISIRARMESGDPRIHYRIVDEYETDFSFTPKTSNKPLTQGELIAMIDGVDDGRDGGLALCYNQMNADGGSCPESLREFTTLSSEFYPDLYDHYDEIHEDWMREELAKLDALDELEEAEES
ncbi:hypothetical protein [Haloferula sp.]|uniref:hypothetical protein n=1 Tax=Haloferula sp. TaxID=2497595 RepID=UPI003C75D72B